MSVVYCLLVELAVKQMRDQGLDSIRDRLFDVAIDETWSAKFNGHPRVHDGIPVAGVYVSCNGMPFTILDPGPGPFPTIGGRPDEDALIAALKRVGAELPPEVDAPAEPETEASR